MNFFHTFRVFFHGFKRFSGYLGGFVSKVFRTSNAYFSLFSTLRKATGFAWGFFRSVLYLYRAFALTNGGLLRALRAFRDGKEVPSRH